jgi:hypothetical protein
MPGSESDICIRFPMEETPAPRAFLAVKLTRISKRLPVFSTPALSLTSSQGKKISVKYAGAT